MNSACVDIETIPSSIERLSDGEQLVQFTHYTRSHSDGGHTDFFKYIVASNGKEDIKCWEKDYLSDGKEQLYVQALRNLFRKLDFIELNQSLEMDDISEEQYNRELEVNESNYLIPAPIDKPSVQQIIQITDIVRKIGRESKISVDEVSEIFSLDMDKAISVLNE